jgi:hypothetical protein
VCPRAGLTASSRRARQLRAATRPAASGPVRERSASRLMWRLACRTRMARNERVMEAAGLSFLVEPVSSTTSAFTGKLAANHRAALRRTPA